MKHWGKVVIGTWPLSGDFGPVKPSEVEKTLESCLECGFEEFDTAPNYGLGFAEFMLGKVLPPHIPVNTKCGNRPFEGKSFEIENLEKSLHASLKRLNRDSVNVLFVHNPRNEVEDYGPILAWFERVKKQGLVQRSGISLAKNFDYPITVLDQFDVVQDDGNILDQRFLEAGWFGKVHFMARSPLASGLLGGHITRENTFPPEDHRSSWLKGERLDSILTRIEIIEQEFPLPIATLARHFLLQSSHIHRVIFGVKRPEHARQLKADIEEPQLPDGAVERLCALYQDDFGLVGQRHLSY